MCYYMRNCIRLTIIKRLNIEAFWFFCAVLPLQNVGQTIGITSSSQLWQYIKYSQFRFLQLYYTAKQLSSQSFCFFANWTARKAAAVLFWLEYCYSRIPRGRTAAEVGESLPLHPNRSWEVVVIFKPLICDTGGDIFLPYARLFGINYNAKLRSM